MVLPYSPSFTGSRASDKPGAIHYLLEFTRCQVSVPCLGSTLLAEHPKSRQDRARVVNVMWEVTHWLLIAFIRGISLDG
mgnify:FL=1